MSRNTELNIISTVLFGICIVFITSLALNLLIKLYCKGKSFRKNRSNIVNIIPTFGEFISCIIIISIDIGHAMYLESNNLSILLQTKTERIIQVNANVWQMISIILLYYILISRIYHTFKRSKHRMKNIWIAYYVTLMSLFVIIGIIYCIILIIYADVFIGAIMLGVLLLIDIIMNISILILFIHKLKCVIVDTFHTDGMQLSLLNNDSFEDASINEFRMDKHNFKYINLMSKFCVLGILTIVSNFTLMIISIYGNIGTFPSSKIQEIMWMFNYHARALASAINCLALYLVFKINEKIYYKLCINCHNLYYKCCDIQTRIRMRSKAISTVL